MREREEEEGKMLQERPTVFFPLCPGLSLKKNRKMLFLRLRAVGLPARFPSSQWAAAAVTAAARRSPPAGVAE